MIYTLSLDYTWITFAVQDGKVQECVRFLVQLYRQTIASVQIMEANYGVKNRVGVGASIIGSDRYLRPWVKYKWSVSQQPSCFMNDCLCGELCFFIVYTLRRSCSRALYLFSPPQSPFIYIFLSSAVFMDSLSLFLIAHMRLIFYVEYNYNLIFFVPTKAPCR